jgi:hypothetical protein
LNTTSSYLGLFHTGIGWVVQSPAGISLNTWTHAAIVRHNGTVTVYVNGVSVATASDSTIYNTVNGFVFGAQGGSDNLPFTGNVVGARVSTVARYTANFTPPTSQFTLPNGAASSILVSRF